MPPSLQPAIANLLQEYMDVFPQDVPPGLPPIRGIEHQIDLIPGASLPNHAPYRTNPEETKEIQRQIQSLLDKGYIHESLTVPIILVPKKDGSSRMCTDCRAISDITIRYHHPMIGVDPLGVARSLRIHKIYGREEDEHEEHDEHDTQIEGKHTHTRYTPVVLIGPIHQLNRITRKRLQE
jgi:hypothetical protein